MRTILVLSLVACTTFPLAAAQQDRDDRREPMIARGMAFLAASQADDGSWSREKGPGITALVTASLLGHGRTADDPSVARGLAYLEQFVQPTGGIHHPATLYRNYETCLAMMCFEAADRDARYGQIVDRAEAFVKGIQWDADEGYDASNPGYGGAGYGKHNRPDLSNTQFLLDALHASGVQADDPALARALTFVSRCQNFETEHNQTKFPKLNPDGGFYYTVAAGGSSQAGTLPNGGLRSYGSMTYAGLKSMIYAGVEGNDPRVKAAVSWIEQHYTLDENPGMGAAGLYYYYQTFAKALAAMGQEEITDARGNKHRWRDQLARELAARQQDDGSWVNAHDRWYEGDPNLVTAYALLALSH